MALQSEDLPTLFRVGDELREASAGTDAAIHAMVLVGLGYRNAGRYAEAGLLFRRAWTKALTRLLPLVAVDAGYWLAANLADMGRLKDAEVVVAEVDALVARVGDPTHLRGRSRTIGYEIALARGDWLAARSALIEASEAVIDPHARLVFHQLAASWSAVLGGPNHVGVRPSPAGHRP